MGTFRRTFTIQEKLQILKQAGESGIIRVLKSHKLSYSVYSRWKQQFESNQLMHFEDIQQAIKEKEQLEIENARLRKIVAEQALTMEVRNEQLLKNNIFLDKG
jgi:putative transposase